MEFGQAIETFFKRYVDFQGRSSRSEYWWFMLFSFLVGLATGIIDLIIGLPVFQTLWTLGIALGGIALGIRRLHDIDRTGFWLLTPFAFIPVLFIGGVADSEPILGLSFIVYIGFGITLFVFSLLPGTKGANRFGPNPLDNF